MAVKKSLSEHNKKPKIKLQQQELTEMEHDEFLQVIRSPFHFATCDAVLRGCKIVDISKPLQWRRLSKKVRSHPLAPSAKRLRPQAVGERTVRLPEIFRAMARFSPSAPSGHLPRRGRFFDTLDSPFWWAVFCFKQPAHKAHDTIVYFANAAGGLRGKNDRSRRESPFCSTL